MRVVGHAGPDMGCRSDIGPDVGLGSTSGLTSDSSCRLSEIAVLGFHS